LPLTARTVVSAPPDKGNLKFWKSICRMGRLEWLEERSKRRKKIFMSVDYF
jgi:hypothetical protein